MRDTMTGTIRAAQELIEAGEFEQAERLLRQLRAESDDLQILYLLGLGYYRAGRFGAALDAFGLLVESAPDDHRALYSLALAQEKVGDLDGAGAALARSLAIKPDFASARDKIEELRARAQSATAGDAQPRPTLAGKLEDGTRTTAPARLLATGRRRVSSVGGAALWAVVLSGLGLVIAGSTGTMANRLAEWSLLGRTPQFYADRLAELDASGVTVGREVLARDAETAVASVAERAATMASLLDVLAGGLLAGAGAIMIGAVLGALLTRYDVYDHRLDVTSGFLRRTTRTLWLFALSDVVYEQPLWLLVTGDARIRAKTDSGDPASIVGYGNADHMRRLWAELRDAAVVERRAMRRWWV